MRTFSICILYILAISILSICSSSQKKESVALQVYENGKLVLATAVGCESGWISQYSGDPLTLKYAQPLSMSAEPYSVGLLIDTNDAAINFNASFPHHIIFKHSATETACPYPLEPESRHFLYKWDDGAAVLIRLISPEEIKIFAKRKNQETCIPEVDYVETARIQLSGDMTTPLNTLMLEYRIAYLDNAALLASVGERDKEIVMRDIIALLQHILRHYYKIHNCYPNQLCQLFTGPTRVISQLPRSPFDYSGSLCTIGIQAPFPDQYLRYYSDVKADSVQDFVIDGYWLALIGEGQEVKPVKALPEDAPSPFQAIAWFEVHNH